MMKSHVAFGLACLVLILAFTFGSKYYHKKQTENLSFLAQENYSVFVRDYSQSLGSDEAKVYLIELMDPACETCAAFYPFVKQ
ncbi:MAG: disulfide bond formation protein DsbA, partial [Desulfobulbaceae bacterium]